MGIAQAVAANLGESVLHRGHLAQAHHLIAIAAQDDVLELARAIRYGPPAGCSVRPARP